jgi:hypothetical protein
MTDMQQHALWQAKSMLQACCPKAYMLASCCLLLLLLLLCNALQQQHSHDHGCCSGHHHAEHSHTTAASAAAATANGNYSTHQYHAHTSRSSSSSSSSSSSAAAADDDQQQFEQGDDELQIDEGAELQEDELEEESDVALAVRLGMTADADLGSFNLKVVSQLEHKSATSCSSPCFVKRWYTAQWTACAGSMS